MPCNDGGYPSFMHAEDVREFNKKIDKLTRMLCGLCKAVDRVQDAELNMELIDSVKGLRQWWNKHQAIDRKREASEKAERERMRKVKAALKKLTPEELELLGIDRRSL